MSYCKVGEKVVVKYHFPENKETTYTTKNAPVEIKVQASTAKHYVFTGYYCEYWIDEFNQETGKLLGSQRYYDSGLPSSSTLMPDTKIVYPPFVILEPEWGELTGFSNYCDYQAYRQGLSHFDAYGKRRVSYFNFYGSATRSARDDSACHLPYIPRDITFRRVDGKQDPLKWEIEIIDSKQNIFKDYGLQVPSYTVQCGDCPQDSMRCDSNSYPGYICQPCSEMTSEITAMRSTIRRMNG